MKLTVLGLGEAGSLIAKGLANQGVEVVAFDPAKPKHPIVPLAESAEEAVEDADVVFSLNSSTVSVKVAQQVANHLKPGAIYCDLNTGTPALKKRLSEIMPAGSFVDVAVMKPVPGLAEKVPLVIAGAGAKKFEDLFASFSKMPDIDFLSIDTEGSEKVILSSIDFSKFKPHVICIEHNYRKENRIFYKKFLKKKGYRLIYPGISRWDSWFVINK